MGQLADYPGVPRCLLNHVYWPIIGNLSFYTPPQSFTCAPGQYSKIIAILSILRKATNSLAGDPAYARRRASFVYGEARLSGYSLGSLLKLVDGG